jgi:hypothetical protein
MMHFHEKNYLKLFVCLLIVFISGTILPAKDLKIRKADNSCYLLLSENGNLKTDTKIEKRINPISQPVTPTLVLKKNDNIKMAVSVSKLQIKGALWQFSHTEPLTGDFKIFKSPLQSGEQVQAFIGANNTSIDGDLFLRGKAFDVTMPVYSEIEVDKDLFYVQDGSANSPELQHMNIYSGLYGIEGRVEFNKGIELYNKYYIKDHSGSIRMTVNEQGENVENLAYASFGTIKTLSISPESGAREKFMGRVFDNEGAEYCELVYNIKIKDFPVNLISPPSGYFELTFDDGLKAKYNFIVTGDYLSELTSLLVRQSETFTTSKEIVALKCDFTWWTDVSHSETYTIFRTESVALKQKLDISMDVTKETLVNNLTNDYYTVSLDADPVDILTGTGFYNFGARNYCPQIGMWTSSDNVSQYVNSYSFCGGNPVNNKESDGNLSIAHHLLLGMIEGYGIWELMGDWYRENNPLWDKVEGKWITQNYHFGEESKKSTGEQMQMVQVFLSMDVEEVNRLYNLNLTEKELDGIKMHAVHDMWNEVSFYTFSPLESFFGSMDPWLGAGVQDVEGTAVLGYYLLYPIAVFFTGGILEPIMPILAIDFAISMINILQCNMRGIDMYVNFSQQ